MMPCALSGSVISTGTGDVFVLDPGKVTGDYGVFFAPCMIQVGT